MAVSVQNCEKPLIEVKWSVAIPRVGHSADSDWFPLEGNYWKLRLVSSWNPTACDETWAMFLSKFDRNQMFQKFPLTAYIRDKTRDFFMGHKEITTQNTEIWSYSQRLFLNSYPHIKVAGNTLIFIFTFDFGTLGNKVSRSSLKEHKFVQTSGPIAPPSYFDDRPCMENLSQALRKLMDEGTDTNVQLKCGACRIAAHNLILGARSEVFRTMMQSDMLEGREGFVEIVDMEPNVFEIFVRYIYTGTLPELTEDTATPLYEAGDKYHVEALRKRCGAFIADNLTRDNVLRILTMADAHSDKDLKDHVVSYILEEKIPSTDDEWSTFCDDKPKLANEVLNRAYKQLNCSQ